MLIALALSVGACDCDPPTFDAPPAPIEVEADASMPDTRGGFPDTGDGDRLLLTRVAPDHGPFIGGNAAVIRGGGFTDETFVSVGGREVQPADIDFLDPNRLTIVLPAGDPGPADVTVRVGDSEATLPDGYTYDRIYVDPSRGSTGGGTLVTLTGTGTSFQPEDDVSFGGVPCEDVQVISDTVLTCVTPPSAIGSVDVRVDFELDGTSAEIPDGFEYYDSSDPFDGGLGGGALEGTMNITVIDATTGMPVADAFTILGEDLDTEHQGLTGLTGQIAFSGDDIVGNQTVHVAKFCYEKTSFVSFDAQDVTIFLVPWMDPMCGMGDPEPPPVGRGRNGAFVSGELIWTGPNEMGPNPWDNIPPAREGWERVSYVYATQPCAGDSLACINPDPGLGGSLQRVLETPAGARGYPYTIFVRPSAFAVYALAGLENQTTREFLPYVMGVARNVLAGPGEMVEDVDFVMNIPLDHYLDARLEGIPGEARTGPDRFELTADIDLGGEGVIVRRVNGVDLDLLTSRRAERAFRFFAQPALLGALEDGRYRVESSWLTGDFGGDPSSHVRRTGIREVDTEVVVDGWVGIPQATSPGFGERIPSDRVLRWEAEGGVTPDLHLILMLGGDGNPAWRMFVPGDQTEAPIPNLDSIPEISDISSGFVTWVIYAIQIPGFEYDEVSYADLANRRWSAWALDIFTAQR